MTAATAASATPPFRLGHVPGLDGVRGVAILTVVLYHAGFPIAGYLGVDVFFVLSGFLITSLLLSEHAETGRVRLRRFYRRRALRLLSALVVLLAVAVVYAVLAGDAKTLASVPFAGAYLMNWAVALGHVGPTDSVIGHTWSLAIEEQFYLLWPPVLLALLAVGRRAALAGAAVLATASAVLRVGLWDGANLERLYFGADAHADGLLVGCALAVLLSLRGGDVRVPRGVVPPAALVVALAFAGPLLFGDAFVPGLVWGGWALFGVAVGVLLLHVVTAPESGLARALRRPSLVMFGTVSYGLYLWHTPIFAVAHEAAWSPMVRVVVMVGGTAVATWASYRFVETPFLRLKDRPSAGWSRWAAILEGRGGGVLRLDRGAGRRRGRVPVAGQVAAPRGPARVGRQERPVVLG